MAYPLVKKVLKNKTVHSPGHLFLITSKVYGFLLQLLYLLNLIFKNLLSGVNVVCNCESGFEAVASCF